MTRKLAATAAALSLLAGTAHGTEPASSGKRLDAEYVITWLGLPVYSGTFAIAWNGDRYRVRFQAEAQGIARLANSTTVEWESSGRLTKGVVQPEYFAQANTFRRQTRRITLAYGAKGPPSVSVVPPESPGKRPPVPDTLKAATLDPLSATFAAFAMAPTAKGCAYKAQVFEGLRRTDVRLEHTSSERTPAPRGAGLGAQAFVCELHAKRLAGYEEKHFRQNPDPLPPATLWVARHEGAGLWLPAQLRFESQYGAIYAHLTRVKISNGSP